MIGVDMELFPNSDEARRAKARANRVMFDHIAPHYDLLNLLMSLGQIQYWRRRLVECCAISTGSRCLDLCCGTGKVTRALAQRGAAVIGVDASAGMLKVAKARSGQTIGFVQGDALCLPFPDNTFDAVTIAFGNRNVASIEQLYAEMRRVARHGGRIASLEVIPPTSALLNGLFFFYFNHLPPLFARLFGTDPMAYAYLSESVRNYPDARHVTDIMHAAGLHEVRYHALFGGIVALHVGVKR